MLFAGVLLEALPVKQNQRRWILVIESIVVALFLGLRYRVGADWSLYEYVFEFGLAKGNTQAWEPGYYWLSTAVSMFVDNYYVLQFFVSVFLVWVIARWYWQEEYVSLLLFALLFLSINDILFSQVRQAVALGIVVLSAKYIFQRNMAKFAIVVVIASLFHISAILAFPLYFCTAHIKKWLLLVLLVLSEVLAQMHHIVWTFVKMFVEYMPIRLANIAELYLKDAMYSGAKEFQTGIYAWAAFLLVVLVVALVAPKSNKDYFAVNTLVVATMVKNISSCFLILDRFVPYYIVFGLASYTLMFNWKMKTPARQTIYHALVSFVLLLFMSVPYLKMLTNTAINPSTNRPSNAAYVPYYNVIHHPAEADQRKDWWEQ